MVCKSDLETWFYFSSCCPFWRAKRVSLLGSELAALRHRLPRVALSPSSANKQIWDGFRLQTCKIPPTVKNGESKGRSGGSMGKRGPIGRMGAGGGERHGTWEQTPPSSMPCSGLKIIF